MSAMFFFYNNNGIQQEAQARNVSHMPSSDSCMLRFAYQSPCFVLVHCCKVEKWSSSHIACEGYTYII